MLRRREGNCASPYHFLDQLYHQVLRASIRSEQHEDELILSHKLRSVVGSVVAAQHPLSVAVHAIFLDIEIDDVTLVVESLSALLRSTSEEPVRIFHPSFPDFIVSPRRCDDPRFVVSLEEHHLRLALSCLALLNKHLRYNMANLEDPDVANSRVKDLDGRLARSIYELGNRVHPSLPQALFYAARYWTTHVVSSSSMHSEPLLDALSRFCNEHLFHWLELLSLIRGLAYGTQSNLLALISCFQENRRYAGDARVSRVADLLHDTVRLLQAYAEPIRFHALHTFHSAYVTMPHCPLLDTLAQANMPEARHTLVSPRAAHWESSGPVLQAGSDVTAVAVVPNQPLIVACTNSGTLRAWNMEGFEEVAQLRGHQKIAMAVAVSSDGSQIVSGSLDRTIRVWDGRTFEEVGFREHEDEVNSVAFSPDGSLIASGTDDCTVWIWNARTLAKVTRLTGHKGLVSSVTFFPDGTRIASASWDCTVRIWDTRTYEPLHGLQCSGQVFVIAISPDSTQLALGEYTSGTEGILRMFDPLTLTEQAKVNISPGNFLPWAIGFSPAGDLIASGTASGAIQVRDAISLSDIATITGHHGQVMSIAFSSNGSQIISGSWDGTVRIRPVASSEEPLAPIPGHDARVRQVVFSSDGSRVPVVSGSDDKTVRIWNGLTYEELAVLRGHEETVWAVAYSPDGSQVISGSRDFTIRVWNALNFQEIAVLRGHRDWVNFVTFSPDGALIASCSYDHTVRIWSSFTLQEFSRLEGHRDTVWSVAFSPNGTRLVSASEDKTVRVWDAVNLAQVAELKVDHHSISELCPAFSFDSNAILTRYRDDGPSWVCSDKNDSAHHLFFRDAR
jgi:WD40 repeat protein